MNEPQLQQQHDANSSSDDNNALSYSRKLLGSKRKFMDSFGTALPTSSESTTSTSMKKSTVDCSSTDLLDWSSWLSNGDVPTSESPTSSESWTKTVDESRYSGLLDDRLAGTVPSSHSAKRELNYASNSIDYSNYASTATTTTTVLTKRKRSAHVSELDCGENALFDRVSHLSQRAEAQKRAADQLSLEQTVDSLLQNIPTTEKSQPTSATLSLTTSTNSTAGVSKRSGTKRRRFLTQLTGEPYHDSLVHQAREGREMIKEMRKPVLYTEEELQIRLKSVERANQHFESMPMTRRTEKSVPLTYHPTYGRIVCQTKRHCRLPMEVLLSREQSTINGPYKDLRNFVLDLDLTVDQLLEHQFIGATERACWEETRRPQSRIVEGPAKCTIIGCERHREKMLLCKRHYDRYQTISRNLVLRKPWWAS